MKKIYPLLLLLFSLSSCTTVDRASKDAARVDNEMNAGDARIIRHMQRYEG